MMNRHCTPQPSQPLGHPSMGHPPSGDSRRRLRACPEQRTAQPLLRGALGFQTLVRDVCVMGPRPQTITKRKTAWHRGINRKRQTGASATTHINTHQQLVGLSGDSA